MKAFNVSLLLSLGITLISCQKQSEIETLNASLETEEHYLSDEAHPNVGAIISQSEASQKLRRYLEERSDRLANGRLDRDENYGFIYGLQTLKDYLSKIDEVNKTRPLNNQITAIRIYKAIDLDKNGEPYDDVFLVPVLRDKSDLFELEEYDNTRLRSQNDDGLILNTSIPCPNQCN